MKLKRKSRKTGRCMKGEKNYNWRGGVSVRKDGRVLVFSPDHPNCSTTGYVLRYRLVMEEKLGRLLTKNEIVHHINHDPNDDRPENLEVMVRGDHMRLHDNWAGKRFINTKGDKWAFNYDACIKCGTTEVKHAAKGECRKCYLKRYN